MTEETAKLIMQPDVAFAIVIMAIVAIILVLVAVCCMEYPKEEYVKGLKRWAGWKKKKKNR